MGKPKLKEKNYAKILYVDKRLSVQEVLTRSDIEVSERTLRKWINDESWDKLRKSFLVTRQNQIVMLYDQLEFLNNDISKREVKVATPKEAQTITKITLAIKSLETEASLGETIEVGKNFIDFMKDLDFQKAQMITGLFDQFIKSKL